MGEFTNATWLKVLAWFVAILIAVLNVWLLALAFRGAYHSLLQHENLRKRFFSEGHEFTRAAKSQNSAPFSALVPLGFWPTKSN